jgi:cobalt-zinc-cadmium efflux system protein
MNDSHPLIHSMNQKRALFFSFTLNASIAIFEFVGGLISGSLALISDSVHNLGDSLAILLALFALIWSLKDNTQRKTFGNKRFEILAALFNSVLLISSSLYLIIISGQRLQHINEIDSGLMLPVATAGLIANLLAVWLLHNHKRESLNFRAAYLHLLGDSLSSVAVIAGALLIQFFKWHWIDPAISLFIGIFIIWETLQVLKESVSILMQWVPEHLDIYKIKLEIEKVPGVNNIHHLHIWQLNDNETHIEFHLDVNMDITVSQTHSLRTEIESMLTEQFGIHHTTIQFEFNSCIEKEMVLSRHKPLK